MEDPTIPYREAMRARSNAADRMRIIAEAVTSLARQFDGFGGPGFPLPLLKLHPPFSVNTESWPSAEQINETFAAFRRAHDAALVAWESIPESERHSFIPPGH